MPVLAVLDSVPHHWFVYKNLKMILGKVSTKVALKLIQDS